VGHLVHEDVVSIAMNQKPTAETQTMNSDQSPISHTL